MCKHAKHSCCVTPCDDFPASASAISSATGAGRVAHLGGLPALPDTAAEDASMLGEAALLMAIGREDDCPGRRLV